MFSLTSLKESQAMKVKLTVVPVYAWAWLLVTSHIITVIVVTFLHDYFSYKPQFMNYLIEFTDSFKQLTDFHKTPVLIMQ